VFQRNSIGLEECKLIQVKTQLSKPVHPNTENVQLRYSFEQERVAGMTCILLLSKLLLNEKE